MRLTKRILDPTLSLVKRLELTPSGIRYLPEHVELNNRILRRYNETNHLFYRILCVNEKGLQVKNMKYVSKVFFKSILNNLQILGNQLWFLAFSASQLRAGSCWFIQQQNNRTAQDYILELGDFSKVYPASKRAARIGQMFSASWPVKTIDMRAVDQKTENDLTSLINPSKMFSDGIGKISSDLIAKVYHEILEPKHKIIRLSAIQIRYAGYKGVLAEDKGLKENTIIFRDSMKKFEADPTDLELLEFNKYRAGFLNRQIIILLITLGVRDEIFLALQQETLADLQNCNLKNASIYKYFAAESHDAIQLGQIQTFLRRMINSGFDTMNEPYLNGIMQTLKYRAYMHLKTKSNILVKKAARLLGVLDEYGILEENEVFVIVSQDDVGEPETIAGQVLLTKNPCIYPGDIKIVTAVASEKARQYFGHFINCVVFPQKGEIPLTCQISGSDLDGVFFFLYQSMIKKDTYFVSWDQRLLPPKCYPPLNYDENVQKKQERKKEITQDDYLSFFLEYLNSDTLGTIANSHLAIADQSKQLALDKKCLELSKLHSEAVDFAKTGKQISIGNRNLKANKWPDYMGKKNEITYESQTVLGVLYRQVVQIIKGVKKEYLGKESFANNNNNNQIDSQLIYNDWESQIDECITIYEKFAFNLNLLISDFGIANEFEIYSGNFSQFNKFLKLNKQKNLEDIQRRIIDQVILIKKDINEMFYKSDINTSMSVLVNQPKSKLKAKASALYIISYCNYLFGNNVNAYTNSPYKQLLNNFQFKELLKKEQKFIGCAWFVCSDLLLAIKKKADLQEKSYSCQQVDQEAEYEENDHEVI